MSQSCICHHPPFIQGEDRQRCASRPINRHSAIRSNARPTASHRADRGNPFPVIAGTSAGAINAAALACRADDFDAAVAGICEVWENFHADQVYRSDSIGVIRTGARWLTMMSIGWVIARWRRARPRSLLDNKPLEALLETMVSTERLHKVMREGICTGSRSRRRATARACTSPSTTRSTTSCRGRARSDGGSR